MQFHAWCETAVSNAVADLNPGACKARNRLMQPVSGEKPVDKVGFWTQFMATRVQTKPWVLAHTRGGQIKRVENNKGTNTVGTFGVLFITLLKGSSGFSCHFHWRWAYFGDFGALFIPLVLAPLLFSIILVTSGRSSCNCDCIVCGLGSSTWFWQSLQSVTKKKHNCKPLSNQPFFLQSITIRFEAFHRVCITKLHPQNTHT